MEKLAEESYDGFQRKYLLMLLENAKRQERRHGKPFAYKRGRLDVQPVDPQFLLADQTVTPNPPVLRPLFLCLPEHFVGNGKRLQCPKCSHKMGTKGQSFLFCSLSKAD